MRLYLCKDCIDNLYDYDIELNIFVTSCEEFVQDDWLYYNNGSLNKEIRRLEKMGYIISLEHGKRGIIIKPLGYFFREGEHHFCPLGHFSSKNLIR